MKKLAAALLVPLLLACSMAQAAEEPRRVVAVNGQGEVSTRPDRARLNLAADALNTDLKAAEAEVNRIVRAYLAEAKSLGAKDEQISTAGININPEYVWDEKTRRNKLVGYRARRDIDIVVSDLDKLGDFVLRATKVGVNHVSAPVLESSKSKDLMKEALAKAQPILDPMAKAVIHAGQLGAGQAAKICNNMILGATMVATCEAFVLAQKLGLDPNVFFDISSKASGQSWSMTSYAPLPGVGPDTPADHDYEGGFATALMLKDLKLAEEAAQSVGAYTPMGAEAEKLYQRFVDRGGASKDFSGIIKMIDDSWTPPKE